MDIYNPSERQTPKDEIENSAEVQDILKKVGDLMSSFGLQAGEKDVYTLEWTHRDGGFQLLLETGITWSQKEADVVEEYALASLVAIDASDRGKGMMMQLQFHIPIHGDEAAVTYREFDVQQRYDAVSHKNVWRSASGVPAQKRVHEGGLSWFEVGLSLMEHDLQAQNTQDNA